MSCTCFSGDVVSRIETHQSRIEKRSAGHPAGRVLTRRTRFTARPVPFRDFRPVETTTPNNSRFFVFGGADGVGHNRKDMLIDLICRGTQGTSRCCEY